MTKNLQTYSLAYTKIQYMTIIDRIAHTTAFVTLVMENWLEQEIAQWVHHEGSIWLPITASTGLSDKWENYHLCGGNYHLRGEGGGNYHLWGDYHLWGRELSFMGGSYHLWGRELSPQTTLRKLPILVRLPVLSCTRQCRWSPLTPSPLTPSPPFFSLSRTKEPAKVGTCAHERRALQQLALNVHVKHSDLTWPDLTNVPPVNTDCSKYRVKLLRSWSNVVLAVRDVDIFDDVRISNEESLLSKQEVEPNNPAFVLLHPTVEKKQEREREMFYLTTHSTHFINGYMASDIWLRTIMIVRN